MFNYDFFLQRSFEVVWAIFRVANHASRVVIKKGLEDRATEYLLNKNSKTLFNLEEIVRLSAQINEITLINTKVILREINNLKTAIADLEKTKIITLPEVVSPNNAPNIEEIFSKPPMLVGDLDKILEKASNQNNEEKEEIKTSHPSYLQKSGNDNLSNDKEISQGIKYEGKSPAMDKIEQKKSGNGKDVNNSKKASENEAIHKHIEKTSTESGNTEIRPLVSPERQDIIISMLRIRSLCHIRDIVSALPGVSERTIRYDIQQLVNKRFIERVGTGGPNSFLRLKKNSK